MKNICNKKFQYYDHEESKLNSTIDTNSGAHTLTYDIISPFNKNNVATIRSR